MYMENGMTMAWFSKARHSLIRCFVHQYLNTIPNVTSHSPSFFLGTALTVPPDTKAPTPKMTPKTPLIMKNMASGLFPPE